MKKKILITGSTDGIGKLAAIALAKKGHDVLIHGRSQQKVDSVVSEIKSLGFDVVGYVADFSDLKSVHRMCSEIKETHAELNILINNAGVYGEDALVTKDGFDVRLVVNYLAPCVLTNSLLSLMKKKSRIINVGSAAQAPVLKDFFSNQFEFRAGNAYAQSKLALTMWSFHLAKTLEDVSVVVVNPGSLLHTKMALEAFGNFWSPADKGSDILCALATSKKYSGITGEYYDNDKGDFGKAHPDAYSERKVARLLGWTAEVID